MKNTLSVLMRLHVWRLDQARRALAQAVGSLDQVKDKQRRLAAEIAREQLCAAEVPLEAGLAYGAYAAVAQAREEELRTSLDEARTREAAARETLGQAFLESKRTEVLLDNQRRRQQEEAKTREAQDIEEIAVSRFLNRQDGIDR
jgi:flagellar export protein FliJ